MSAKLLIIAAAVIGLTAVLVAQMTFLGTDVAVQQVEERNSQLEAMVTGPEGAMMREAGRSKCLSDGGTEAQCDCLVNELETVVKSVGMSFGAAAERKMHEAGNQARRKCGLPPLERDDRVRTFNEVQGELGRQGQ